MTVETKSLEIQSKRENEIIDITEKVADNVKNSRIKNGIITIFVSGSTGALTTIEFEPGLLHDFPEMLSRLAPSDIDYAHEQMWHDGNGRSHVKASLVGPSLTIPFTNQSLTLGTWQQIVFIELDTRNRTRKLVLQIIGE
ncbi:MAG: YjbQ family protein [Nitrosopumilaceae archaeon]|nr:YjbQ family protein [Nitrosopumilaceae archaeon]NIU00632.1 YjbQ family protein [Nitrosopumilaceae archaeon]NIU87020.1 YjbQ family protein [Nitrosopumilaceae archaeon]NIV65604.1 YjbQ family protein [Nitrosopumilaceae archaeon]NIX61234.1 YjbQ family protein [Nitrosopumilaceae archaeon]